MSLETRLQELVTAFVADVRDISTSLGGSPTTKNATVTAALTTTAKNIVGAINELHTEIDGLPADTGAIAEGSNLYFTEARAIASVLVGYAAAAGTVDATDTVISALQKIDANVNAINLADLIDDTAAATDKTYSSNKIDQDIAAAVAATVDMAPGALDTLNELAAAIGNDENFSATLTNSLALKANIADTFSVTQLGATVDTRNYAADYVDERDA